MGFLAYLKKADNEALGAFLAASSENTSYLLGNLLIEPIAKPWRTIDGQIETQTLDVHFPAPRALDVAALVGHNLTSAATIVLKADDTFPPTTTVATLTWRARVTWAAFASTTKRYWRWAISDPANPDGFLQVGYLSMGVKTQLTEGFLIGFTKLRAVENRRVRSEFGVPVLGAKLADFTELSFSFDALDNTKRDELDDFLRSLDGDREPLLLIPDPDAAEAFFARLSPEHEVVQIGFGSAEVPEVVFREDPLGVRLIDALPDYTDGDTTGFTFTRASAARTKNKDLKLVSVAIDVLRSGYYLTKSKRGTLLEGAATNSALNSEDVSLWGKSGVTITVNNADAPDGLTTADKVVEDTGGGAHQVAIVPTGGAGATTDDTLQAIAVWGKIAERTKVMLRATAKDASVKTAKINLSTGVVETQDSGIEVEVETYINSWFRVLFQYDVKSGGSAIALDVRLLNASDLESYTGDGSSGLYLFGGQWEIDTAWPTSYIPTGGSAASRSEDVFQTPFAFGVQTLTSYVRAIEIGQKHADISGVDAARFRIEDSGVTAEMRFGERGSQWFVAHKGSGGDDKVSVIAVGSNWAETQEFLGQVYQDGAVQARISIDGAAPAAGTKSAVPASQGTDWGLPGPLHSDYGSSGLHSIGLLVQRFELRRGVTSDFDSFRKKR